MTQPQMTLEGHTIALGLRPTETVSKDAEYPIVRALGALVPFTALPTSKYWYDSKHTYQNGHPHCAAHGANSLLPSSPLRQKGIDPAWLYHEAQLIDEWPGENYDGTSCRAVVDVLRTHGYIENYFWAQGIDEFYNWILSPNGGPALLAVPWLEGMLATDPKGFIHATGREVGGHLVKIKGANQRTRKVRICNWWGDWWGQKGEAWISQADIVELVFRRWGQICCVTERKKI